MLGAAVQLCALPWLGYVPWHRVFDGEDSFASRAGGARVSSARRAAAAPSLFLDPIQPESPENDWPYINGRHRVQAMFDAGVRRTVIAAEKNRTATGDGPWGT